MRKITFKRVRQLMLMLLTVFACYSSAIAQSESYLSWDNQVGCISYDSNGEPNNPRKELILIEGIENSPCIRVCENSIVNYVMNGSNITDVQWGASGGVLLSVGGSSNTHASINWGNAGSGAINLTIFYNDSTQREITLCIEKINGPKADFSVYGAGQEPVFCLDTPINFQNLSNNNGGSEIVNYFWDFGDGEVSYSYEPTHSYDQAGTYSVVLTVTNNCNCSNKYDLTIHIEDIPNVIISCPSVVCEDGDKHTYSVDDQCGGQWLVEGGTILGQTATTVTVVWDQVDNEGFGFVSYRSECACPYWTTVKIPVVQQIGTIDGEETLCVGEQGLYTLPQWPSTDFVWTLSPTSPSGTHLVFVDQRNQIIVDALQPGTYILKCDYTNTLLGCTGTADIRIDVLEETVITSNQPDEFCSSSGTKTYTTTSGAAVNWELTTNNSVVASSTGVTFAYNFPTGGVYTLTATAGGCLGEPKVITVTQKPVNPTGTIAGENTVCVGTPYDYSFNNTVPNTVLVWEVLPAGAGVFQGDNTGNNVTITFTSAVTAVRIKRVTLDGLGCESGWLTKAVSQVVINGSISSNASIHCPSSQSTFSLNLNGLTPDLVEWSVTNGGGIISGINSNTVTVAWNETGGSQTVSALIRKCNLEQTVTTQVNIYQSPVLTLTGPGEICYGSPLDLYLTAPGVTTGTVEFDFGNGFIHPTPFNPSGFYTLPNPYNNGTGSNINQTITATLNNPNGCNYNPQATTSVIVFPRTLISVTPGYNYEVCPTGSYTIPLTANAMTGVGMTVSYQWFKNGNEILGATSSNYTISNGTQGSTPQGTYYVQVIDSNLCEVFSQNITVNTNCAPPPTCEIVPAPNVNVTANWTACGTVSANVTYNGSPTSIQWLGSPFLTLTGGNNTPNATYSANTPGSHLVTVKVTYQTSTGPCVVQKTVEVKTHYKPDFNTIVECNAGTNISYNVTLLDNSTVFDVSSPITYTFSGTGMTPQTGQNITLTNLAPGTYTYTLTLNMAGKPTCSINKTITLAPTPSTDFTILDSTVCAEQGIILNITNYNPVNTYEFFFGSTSYIASSASSTININTNATTSYFVTLAVTTPTDCTFNSASQSITVTKASFDGSLFVSPNINVCEGTPQTISFVLANPLDTPPSTYIWMKGNEPVGAGASYTPTVSGNYWAILLDDNDCRYTLLDHVDVTIRQRPYVGIIGNSSVCAGEEATVQGVVANGTLERRWLLNDLPMPAPYGTWATNTPLSINVPAATGTYNYTFEVQPAADTDCGNTASLSVTVHPEVTAPSLSYIVDTCEPYKVYVTASGPSSGSYNWSNGDVGQTIVVGLGGAIGVTYTATTGCTATADIMVPQPLERSLWVFPSGCYDICLNTVPAPYILGPLGIVDYYKWLVNGNVAYSESNSSVDPFAVTQAGTYQLTISNDGCDFESGIMHIAPNLEQCEINPCDFKSDVKYETQYQNGVYHVIGFIQNTSGSPITVTITSFNNYGSYFPGSITIPAGSTYTFSPLQLTPNANYQGGSDYVVLQMQGCMTIYPVYFEPTEGQGLILKPAQLQISPNPAEEVTSISYDLGDEFKNAQSLTVYNLMGTSLLSTELNKPSGNVSLSVAGLPSGTYIISVQADGQRAIQRTLVKK